MKFKVIKSGFSYNGNNLLVGQVFEGEDKNEKFFDKPAITINYLGSKVNVPSENLQKVTDETPISDSSQINKYNSNRNMVKSITKLGGLGAGLYLANRMNKGTWGYIGFGLLGYLLGGIVGGQISNVVLKSPDSDSAIPDAIKNTNNTNNTTTNIENKDSKVVALFADMAANPPKSEQEAKDRAAKFGLTKDDITAYNEKQKQVPTFDNVNSLIQVAMKKAGITPNATQTAALKTAFDKWSVTQKKFAIDYMNGFFKVKALTPNTKAWNDAFTDMNNYLMKTYPDEKMKLEVMQVLGI
jgi:hypothetical protein